MPETDFINQQFDYSVAHETKQLLLILSTQRSGSTYLSDLLRICGFGLPHEYFQASQYLQILNRRWQFADNDGRIDWHRFTRVLKSKRTSREGWLSINLHGFHLSRFERSAKHFRDIPLHIVHLKRHSIFEQAISLSEARKTGAWTRAFAATQQFVYDKETAIKALDDIVTQNTLIEAWIAEKNLTAKTIYYEDLVIDPVLSISNLTGIDQVEIQNRMSDEKFFIKKQKRSFEREEAIAMLRRDYLDIHQIFIR